MQIDTDKTFNEPKYRDMIKDLMSSENYAKPFAQDAADRCIYTVKQYQKIANSDDQECNQISMIGLACAKLEFFFACPVDKQNKEIEQCEQLRKSHGRN